MPHQEDTPATLATRSEVAQKQQQAVAPPPAVAEFNEALAKARAQRGDAAVKQALATFGVQRTKDLPSARYREFCALFAAPGEVTPAAAPAAEPPPPIQTAPAPATQFPVTIATSDGMTGKAVALKEGALDVRSAATIASAAYVTEHLTAEHLAERLTDAGPNVFAMFGVAAAASGTIATVAAIDGGNAPPGAIARTRGNFSSPAGPGWLFCDLDLKAMPDAQRPNSTAKVRALVIAACPALGGAPMVVRPSAGAMLVNSATGEQLRGLTGVHIYIGVANAADIPEIGKRINERLILADGGFAAISGAGLLTVRSMLDTAVWQPERIAFIGGAVCEPPVVQQRGVPEVFNTPGAPLALGDVPALTPAERDVYVGIVATIKTAAEPERARVRAAYIARRTAEGKGTDFADANGVVVLRGPHAIELTDGRIVTVAEILDDPPTFHGTTCADPLEPTYGGDNRIARIYSAQSTPVINSNAHGRQVYTLQALAEDEFDAVTDATYSSGCVPLPTIPERGTALLGYPDPMLRWAVPRARAADVMATVQAIGAAVGKPDPLSPHLALVLNAAHGLGGYADSLERFRLELKLALRKEVGWSALTSDDRALLTLCAWLHTAKPAAIGGGEEADGGGFVDGDAVSEVRAISPGRMERGSAGVIVGSSGIGKTSFAMALAARIARVPATDELGFSSPETFIGRPVEHGSVLYFTGEDSGGAARRAARYAGRHELGAVAHIHVVPCVLPLTKPAAAVARVLFYMQQMPAGSPRLALIVIDHLRDALGGDSEDAADVTAPAMGVAETVAKMTDTAVLVLHHMGHEGTRERGSTAIRDKSAFTLLLRANPGGTITGTVAKVKNGPAGEKMVFHLDQGVVVEGPAPGDAIVEVGSTESDAAALSQLIHTVAASSRGVPRKVLWDALVDRYPSRFGPPNKPSTAQTRATEAINHSVKRHWLTQTTVKGVERYSPGPETAPGVIVPHDVVQEPIEMEAA